MEKLIVDLFAGGGGASMGIEMALGRSPDIAINHDPVAIAMHKVNHPETEHYCSDIWAVDPNSVRPGEPVGLLWASPDCKHFSKAKGGKPRDRNIRDLAWVVVDWAEKRKPDVIFVENVEEFQTWGPLDNEGNPIREFAGQTFEDWLSRLRRAGYKVAWRESRASAYGAPTIRKRLAIIASRLGKPVWPKATHGAPDSPEVLKGELEPYRTAARDVIDWTIPCPSIFDTKQAIREKYGLNAVRPLAHNTGRRIAVGIRRHVIDAQRRTIVIVDTAHGSVSPDGKVKRWGDGVKSPDEPLGSVTAGGVSQAVVMPTIARFNGDSAGNSINDPMPTVTANSFIKRPGGAAPLGVVAPVLTYAQQGGNSRSADEPHHTVTASRKDQNQVIAASLVQTGYGERKGQAPRALDPNSPLGTVVAGGGKHAPVAAFLAQHNTDRNGRANPGRPAGEPLSTVTASGSQQNVVTAHMMSMKGTNRRDSAADEPARTVCAGGGHAALVSGALVKYYSTPQDPQLDEPLHTVTVKDRFGLAGVALNAPPFGPEHEARAREVAEFMRFHGQWPSVEDGGEFVTIEIDGITFVIADIGLRMLVPRELFNAQGFPPDYRIDRDDDGNVFSKSDQVGLAGNSVSPPWAAAHIAENCGHLRRMAEAAE